jgi:hypothetical protein
MYRELRRAGLRARVGKNVFRILVGNPVGKFSLGRLKGIL